MHVPCQSALARNKIFSIVTSRWYVMSYGNSRKFQGFGINARLCEKRSQCDELCIQCEYGFERIALSRYSGGSYGFMPFGSEILIPAEIVVSRYRVWGYGLAVSE